MKDKTWKNAKIDFHATISGRLSMEGMEHLYQLLEAEQIEITPDIVPGNNGGMKIRAIDHLGALQRSKAVMNRVLDGNTTAMTMKLKLPDLRGGIRAAHVHFDDHILVMKSELFDKMVLETQIEANRILGANTIER